MNRAQETRFSKPTIFSIRPEKATLDVLDRIAEQRSIKRSRLIDQILREYVERFEKSPTPALDEIIRQEIKAALADQHKPLSSFDEATRLV